MDDDGQSQPFDWKLAFDSCAAEVLRGPSVRLHPADIEAIARRVVALLKDG